MAPVYKMNEKKNLSLCGDLSKYLSSTHTYASKYLMTVKEMKTDVEED